MGGDSGDARDSRRSPALRDSGGAEPLPIIATVMLLLSPSGVSGGASLAAGRVATLAGLTLVVALLAERLAAEPGGGEGGGGLRVAFGCLLIAGAAVVWVRRDGKAAAPPAWMRAFEGASPGRALWLGGLLTVANLKELAFVAGAAMIVAADAPPFGTALALSLVFGALAGFGAALPVLWTLATPEGSQDRLRAVRSWLERNNSLMMAAVLLVIGVMLVGSGLEALQTN